MKKVYSPPCDKDGVPDGHKVFTHQGRIYFADGSGDTPAQNDDGPLIVDTTHPAELSTWGNETYLNVSFRVFVERENSYAAVSTSFDTAMVVMGLAPAMTLKRSAKLSKLMEQISAIEKIQKPRVADDGEMLQTMAKVKTSELTGHALNFVVSQLEGFDHDTAILNITVGDDNGWKLDYLTWEQGGPIIEREKIQPEHINARYGWSARWPNWVPYEGGETKPVAGGPNLLIAAMRCYIVSKLGDEVEVPEELV